MGRKYLMSWVEGQRRWTKQFKGKTYSISARQLGVTESKEGSWFRANEWWRTKQAELEAQNAIRDPANSLLAGLMARRQVAELQNLVAEGDAARKLLAILANANGPQTAEISAVPAARLSDGTEIPAGMVADMLPTSRELAEESLAKLHNGESLPVTAIDEVVAPWSITPLSGENRTLFLQRRIAEKIAPKDAVPTGRTIGEHITAWLTYQENRVFSGQCQQSRYKSYKIIIGHFSEWIKPDTAIDALNAARLESWWLFLCGQVRDKQLKPATAKTRLMTTRQFIKWLATKGLIPLPGNIGERSMRFGDGPQIVKCFTADEIRNLLPQANDRTRLYCLLALNCGMYQNDIAELGMSEVDWQSGIIERPRSKTPNGPKARYQLWPETFELLKKFRTEQKVANPRGDYRVLLTEKGTILVGDGETRFDNIAAAYNRLAKRTGITLAFKHLRKTGSSMLASHSEYKWYEDYYLGHSPKGVTERHYRVPSDPEFFDALTWLRGLFLG